MMIKRPEARVDKADPFAHLNRMTRHYGCLLRSAVAASEGRVRITHGVFETMDED
jgi:hypothetical protein